MGLSLLIWFHLVAAVIWVGGTVFLSVILVPVLKREPFAAQKSLLFRAVARRFRSVVWSAITILLLTGPLLLHQRGIAISEPSGWPTIVTVKLGLVVTLLGMTLVHDLILGPLVGKILRLPPEHRSGFDQVLVLWAPWLARLSLVLTLAILFAAVVLARS
ncbi:MAG: hypothetical protein OEV08_04935 [Nitrospira sp.]|nr:hypothetical protein [Nitrospira sp.]